MSLAKITANIETVFMEQYQQGNRPAGFYLIPENTDVDYAQMPMPESGLATMERYARVYTELADTGARAITGGKRNYIGNITLVTSVLPKTGSGAAANLAEILESWFPENSIINKLGVPVQIMGPSDITPGLMRDGRFHRTIRIPIHSAFYADI